MSDVREPGAKPNGTASAPADRAPLVMLLPAGEAAPKPLAAGLRQRDAPFETLTSAAAAMTAIMRRHARGVIIIDPERQPQAEELLLALERWAPSASRWRYEAVDGKPQLTRCPSRESPVALNPDSDPTSPAPRSPDASEGPEAETATPGSDGAPATGPAPEDASDQSAAASPPRQAAGQAPFSQRESLSADELAVLLGPADDEDENEDEDDQPQSVARADAAARLVSAPRSAGQGGRSRGE